MKSQDARGHWLMRDSLTPRVGVLVLVIALLIANLASKLWISAGFVVVGLVGYICTWLLEVVTHAENVARGEKAQQTHCKRGHVLDDAYLDSLGRRNCRECKRMRDRARRKVV